MLLLLLLLLLPPPPLTLPPMVTASGADALVVVVLGGLEAPPPLGGVLGMEYPLVLLAAAAASPSSFSPAMLWFRECENLRSSANAAMRARSAIGRRTPFTGSTVEEEGEEAWVLALVLALVGPEGAEVWVKLLLGKGPLEGEEAREKEEEFKEEEEEEGVAEERRVGLEVKPGF